MFYYKHLRFILRTKDFRQKDSDPYAILEFLESVNFKKKFETAINQIPGFVENYFDQEEKT